MKYKNVKYLFIVLFLIGIENSLFCQKNNSDNPFRGISLDERHFIAMEVQINKNVKTKISLTNQDSTYDYILFDGIFYKNETVIITDEEFVVDLKKKYPNSILLLLPVIKSGVYYYLYKTKLEKYSLKFLYIK